MSIHLGLFLRLEIKELHTLYAYIFIAHGYDIKYSYLIQIICKQIYLTQKWDPDWQQFNVIPKMGGAPALLVDSQCILSPTNRSNNKIVNWEGQWFWL